MQDGPLLVLNAAEERLQIVLGEKEGDDVRLLCAQEWLSFGRSTTILVPALEQMFKLGGIAVSDLKGIACVRGPGSFTGIRIIMATAQGMTAGLDCGLAGLELPRLIADQSLGLINNSGTLVVLTYARKKQVYIQAVTSDGTAIPKEVPTFFHEVQAMRIQDAVDAIADISAPVFLVGSGLIKNPDFFQEQLPQATVLPESLNSPRPEVLLQAAASAVYSHDSIDPLYVRPSDAEENLPQIAAKRGLASEDAEAALEKAVQDLMDS